MKIIISGFGGSGGTTLARWVAEKFNYPLFYAGLEFRNYAIEKGFILDEYKDHSKPLPHRAADLRTFFSKVQMHDDKLSVDEYVDALLYEKISRERNFVFDTKLFTHYLAKYHPDFKYDCTIFIDSAVEVRAKRVLYSKGFNDSQITTEMIENEAEILNVRFKNDVAKYKKIYDIDISTLPEIATFTLDTTNLNLEQSQQALLECLETCKAKAA